MRKMERKIDLSKTMLFGSKQLIAAIVTTNISKKTAYQGSCVAVQWYAAPGVGGDMVCY